jgi:hypothetical protein
MAERLTVDETHKTILSLEEEKPASKLSQDLNPDESQVEEPPPGGGQDPGEQEPL